MLWFSSIFYLKLLKLKGVEYVWSLIVTQNKKLGLVGNGCLSAEFATNVVGKGD